MLHPGLLGLITLPTESPGGGFDSDRRNVFFYHMILHQAGVHVRGMFGYVWHHWRLIWDLTHLDSWKIYYFPAQLR